jgi:hypothetical protein
MSRAHRFARLASALALLAFPAASHAQLAHASATTLGLAGNHTASARGFAAISVNPAGLGTGDSGFGLALAPATFRAGVSPITLGDIYEYQGVVVPDAVKAEWLARVSQAGGLRGSGGAEGTYFALALGSIGLQVSTVGTTDLNVPTGLVEAYLFGNAGRSGEPADLSLADASIRTYAVSTAGLSYGFRVTPQLVLGVTGKLSYGHGLIVGRSTTGSFQSDPLEATLDFTLVTSCTDEVGCTENYVNGGSGVGLDVGGILELEGLTLGASLQDVVNTFSWNEEHLGFRPGTGTLATGDSDADNDIDFDEQPFSQAPSELQQIVRDYGFDPAYRLGAALDLTSALTLTADIHGRFANDGIALGPKYHTGVGAELRAGFLHLRGGLSKVPDALQYAGGFSLVLGPVNLSTAAALENGATRDAFITQFVFSIGDR